jgi:uncharacterized HAD superfamily protein
MPTANIIAVDIDGTLTKDVCWDVTDCLSATVDDRIAAKVREAYRDNWIVMYTARRDHLIPATLRWLRQHNIPFHSFSNNKIPANQYVDDGAVRPDEWVGK